MTTSTATSTATRHTSPQTAAPRPTWGRGGNFGGGRPKAFTRTQCIASLQTVLLRTDGQLTGALYDSLRDGGPSAQVVGAEFGSWTAGVDAALVDIVQQRAARNARWTRNDCLKNVRRVTTLVDTRIQPRSYDLRRGTGPCSQTVIRLCGSWDEALAAAGALTSGRPHHLWDRDSCLSAVKDALGGATEAMSRTDYVQLRTRTPGLPTIDTLRQHVGSWPQVMAALGLPEPADREWRNPWTREQYLEALRDVHHDAGGEPVTVELYQRSKKWGPYGPSFRVEFGSWAKALEAAGITGAQTDAPVAVSSGADVGN